MRFPAAIERKRTIICIAPANWLDGASARRADQCTRCDRKLCRNTISGTRLKVLSRTPPSVRHFTQNLKRKENYRSFLDSGWKIFSTSERKLLPPHSTPPLL